MTRAAAHRALVALFDSDPTFLEATRRAPSVRDKVLALAPKLAEVVVSWAPRGALDKTQRQRRSGALIGTQDARGTWIAPGARRQVARAARALRDAEAALTAARGFGPMTHELAALRARVEGLLAQATVTVPRNTSVERARFARVVRRIIERAGIRAARSRSGIFAAVLSCCLQAAGSDQPEDLFRLVQSAFD